MAGEDQARETGRRSLPKPCSKARKLSSCAAIELAKAGDTQMLKFLLDRILPKERAVRVDLKSRDCGRLD
jgi:hypothetical protein